MRATIPAHALKALLITCAKGDIRRYLNGLRIQANKKTGAPVCITTDGHRLTVYGGAKLLDGPIVPCIIPRDALEKFKIPAKSKSSVDVSVSENGDGPPLFALTYDGAMITGKCLDGVYPDVARVIPKSLTGEAAQFNGDYLADAGAQFRLIHPRTLSSPWIGPNGRGGAIVNFNHPEWLGVVMPMREVERATEFDIGSI